MSAAASPPPRGRQLRIEELRNAEQLCRLEPEWKTVLACSDADPVFLSWEWMQAWLTAYGEREFMIIVARDEENAIAGIAPFYLSRWPEASKGALKVVRLLGDDTADAAGLGMIMKRGKEKEFAAQVVDHLLAKQREWSALALNDLAENASNAALVAEVTKRKWAIKENLAPHLVLSLPGTWNGFLASLSQKKRAAIRAAESKTRTKKVGFRRAATEKEASVGIEDLFRLHTARWKTRGKTGAFEKKARKEFYRKLTQSMLAAGKLDLWTMSIDEAVAAVEFGFIDEGRRIALQSGFDPQYAPLRVGAQLEAKVIEESIRAGVREYDFLAGDDAFKVGWGAQRGEYKSVRCAPPGGAGAAWVKLSRMKVAQKVWAAVRRGSREDAD